MTDNVTRPNTEAVSKETANRIEWQFFDDNYLPVHKSRVIFKNKAQINVYPFSYNQTRGVAKKRVSEIEFRGWSEYENLPKLLKPGERISLTHKRIAPLMRALYSKYPKFNKLILVKDGGTTRFSSTTITFAFDDLQTICKGIDKETKTFDTRRSIAVNNALADISNQFSPKYTHLTRGSLHHFLSHYGDDVNLSDADVDDALALISHAPLGKVTITENFVQTKNKINIAYLEKVLSKFEALLDVKGDNEKDWQNFFDEHGWILASVFPYQVILHKREAYVGGKTIENSEGRVVDFLYQNDFRDNYALLEIKTHRKRLVKELAYREPDAFAAHEDCAGAIAQCLDQKNTFVTDFGQKYKTLDPKVVLIIGNKGVLTQQQARAFELLRNNQKNVDVVTFDEVLDKIYGLRSILNT